MDSIKNLRDLVHKQMAVSAELALTELTAVWTSMFDTANIEKHLTSLATVVQTFYAKITKEATTHFNEVTDEIQKLVEEAHALRQVRGMEQVEIPAQDNRPLLTYRYDLKLLVDRMQEMITQTEELRKKSAHGLAELAAELEEPVFGGNVDFESRHMELTKMKAERLKDMTNMCFNVRRYTQRLELKLIDEHEAMVTVSRLGKSHFEALSALHEKLEDQFVKMCVSMNEILAEIRNYWKVTFQSPIPDLNGICDKISGYTRSNYYKLILTLKRCREFSQIQINEQ